MGIVKCDKDFCPYVPERENLKPLLEFHWGIMGLDTAHRLIDLLHRVLKRLNNGTIAVKPYLTASKQ